MAFSDQSQEKVFRRLKNYIAPALYALRERRKLSRKEFAELLKRAGYDDIDEAYIKDVERGAEHLSFEVFKDFCIALGWRTVQVLKMAKFIYSKKREA